MSCAPSVHFMTAVCAVLQAASSSKAGCTRWKPWQTANMHNNNATALQAGKGPHAPRGFCSTR